jgi:hypothetical protein
MNELAIAVCIACIAFALASCVHRGGTVSNNSVRVTITLLPTP